MENDVAKSNAELPWSNESIETAVITTVDEETASEIQLISRGNESGTQVATSLSGATEPNALNILQITEDEVKLNIEAINSVLNKVGDLPIVIYSISGSTRSGKSYLLNYFIKYFEAKKQQQEHPLSPNNDNYDWINFPLTSHFVWRSGVDRETTGINLWYEPYFVSTDDGPVAVLLMDTQGLFDDKTTARQNAIIFSLTALCSSVTIFNVMRQVNEDLLQQIQYFSSYAHMATADMVAKLEVPSEGNNMVTVSPEQKAFQNLLLLVRDFENPEYVHGLHGAGSQSSGKNFLHDVFQLHRPPGNYPEENTRVREEILQKFENVSAYLLPEPGKTFIRETGDPDEDFLQQLKLFIEHMVSSKNIVQKRINGRSFTGTQFKSFLNTLGKFIDKTDDAFPEVYTLAGSTAFNHYTLVKDLAVSSYIQMVETLLFRLQKSSNLSREELPRYLEHYSKNAHKLFQSMKKFQNDQFDEHFKKQLEDSINDHRSTSHCMHQIKEKVEKSMETFPEISTMTENTLKNKYTISKDISFTHYQEMMEEFVTTSQNASFLHDLNEAHERNSESAKQMFKRLPKFLSVQFDDDYEAQLHNEILQHYEFVKRNSPVAINMTDVVETVKPEAWIPWLFYSLPVAVISTIYNVIVCNIYTSKQDTASQSQITLKGSKEGGHESSPPKY